MTDDKVYAVMNGEDRVTRVYRTRAAAEKWVQEATQPGWCRVVEWKIFV